MPTPRKPTRTRKQVAQKKPTSPARKTTRTTKTGETATGKPRKAATGRPRKAAGKPRKAAAGKPRKAATGKPRKAAGKPRDAKPPKKHRKGASPVFITREDGTRLLHDRNCQFAIEPFMPLIQKLADVWVMPASRVDAALQRLLNPGNKVDECAHYRTVGRELFEWGYYPEALDCFDLVLRAQPDDVDVLELKIAAHENIGEADEARVWNKLLNAVRQGRPTAQRYLLDQFADALVVNLTDVATRHCASLTAPVEHLVLGLQEPGSIVPDELWLSLAGSDRVDLELSLTLPETLIPLHVDRLRGLSAAEDPLLAFTNRFQLDKDLVSWTDPSRIPASLFHVELSEALRRAVTCLSEAGIEIASRCVLAVGHRGGDILVVDRDPSRQQAREHATRARIAADLKRFPSADAIEALAWLCYAGAERRQWLIDLATAR